MREWACAAPSRRRLFGRRRDATWRNGCVSRETGTRSASRVTRRGDIADGAAATHQERGQGDALTPSVIAACLTRQTVRSRRWKPRSGEGSGCSVGASLGPISVLAMCVALFEKL
jgi:hypothetical protein